MEHELWKQFSPHSWPDYDISTLGRVRLRRPVEETRHQASRVTTTGILWIPRRPKGYRAIRLYNATGSKLWKVSELVLTAFISPRPVGMIAYHKNRDSTNDELENLAWDMNVGGMRYVGRGCLTEDQIIYIRTCEKSNAAIAREVERSEATISEIRRGHIYRNVGIRKE
jgi:hypothetical protein